MENFKAFLRLHAPQGRIQRIATVLLLQTPLLALTKTIERVRQLGQKNSIGKVLRKVLVRMKQTVKKFSWSLRTPLKLTARELLEKAKRGTKATSPQQAFRVSMETFQLSYI